MAQQESKAAAQWEGTAAAKRALRHEAWWGCTADSDVGAERTWDLA
jgi:hypothetical protein